MYGIFLRSNKSEAHYIWSATFQSLYRKCWIVCLRFFPSIFFSLYFFASEKPKRILLDSKKTETSGQIKGKLFMHELLNVKHRNDCRLKTCECRMCVCGVGWAWIGCMNRHSFAAICYAQKLQSHASICFIISKVAARDVAFLSHMDAAKLVLKIVPREHLQSNMLHAL